MKIISFIWCAILLSCNNTTLNKEEVDNFKIKREYYKNGLVYSEIVKYSDKRTDSTFYYYYDDMSLKARVNIKDGMRYGPCLFYYRGGNIESYIYFAGRFEEDAMFIREYSLDSQISKEYGIPFMVVFENGLTCQVDSYFDFVIIAAVPPNTRSSVNKYSSIDSVQFNLESTYDVTDEKRISVFRHFLDNAENNKIRIESILVDTMRDYIRKDTFDFNIIVE